ncbi:RNA polymerase sigma-70 factor [Zhouia spongiae]|uniref:RNA polymerase sigma-70 factor n=1 Tax=Zhouia spongiae TaxID=2202721 RepID=A0ABY3YJV6_9FLAO|nr:RNA polymerase sigma-70 factor [Zhouia spongiae]UNY97858.1 RNA polymerase sigma-70 factor [Zhouia spongiae]
MKKQHSSLSDHDLLSNFSEGKRYAFDAIFNRYWKRLFVYCYKVYEDEAICEDVIQEVFVSLWERRADLAINNLESYLFRAVKYKMAGKIRKLKFTDYHIEILEEAENIVSYPENTLEYVEFEDELTSLVNQLPDKCKEVFCLSRYERLNNREIAEKLNISVRTVEAHISNALKYLKTNFTIVSIYLLLIKFF